MAITVMTAQTVSASTPTASGQSEREGRADGTLKARGAYHGPAARRCGSGRRERTGRERPGRGRGAYHAADGQRRRGVDANSAHAAPAAARVELLDADEPSRSQTSTAVSAGARIRPRACLRASSRALCIEVSLLASLASISWVSVAVSGAAATAIGCKHAVDGDCDHRSLEQQCTSRAAPSAAGGARPPRCSGPASAIGVDAAGRAQAE